MVEEFVNYFYKIRLSLRILGIVSGDGEIFLSCYKRYDSIL